MAPNVSIGKLQWLQKLAQMGPHGHLLLLACLQPASNCDTMLLYEVLLNFSKCYTSVYCLHALPLLSKWSIC